MFNGETSTKVWAGYRKPTEGADALGVSGSGELCPPQSRRDQRRGRLPDPRDSCSRGRGAVRWSWGHRREMQPLPSVVNGRSWGTNT